MKTKLFLLLTVLSITVSCNHKEVKETRHHVDWVYDATIYEVNVRQFTEEGTFKAFEEHIPRLKELGVDILWFMPIQPIGVEGRKGTLGSYYSIKDYTQTNTEFGTLNDFKQVVNTAHNAGMKVILDWVANHTSHDAVWSVNRDWYVLDSLGNFTYPFDWSDIAQLNFNNADMRKAMQDAMIFWLKEIDIDGYRCDHAKGVPTDFWEETRIKLKKAKADIFMLAEAEEPELNTNAFDAYYAWNLHHKMNEIAQGKANVNVIREALEQMSKFPDYAIPMYFTSNHDENSWAGTEFERMGDAARTFAALSFILPGMPLIYNGQEAGFNRRLLFFEKDVIDWNDTDNFTAFYQSLIKLKKANKALFSQELGGKLKEITTSKPEEIFAIQREVKNNKIVAIFNLSPNTVDFTIENDNFPPQMQLSPWEYKIH